MAGPYTPGLDNHSITTHWSPWWPGSRNRQAMGNKCDSERGTAAVRPKGTSPSQCMGLTPPRQKPICSPMHAASHYASLRPCYATILFSNKQIPKVVFTMRPRTLRTLRAILLPPLHHGFAQWCKRTPRNRANLHYKIKRWPSLHGGPHPPSRAGTHASPIPRPAPS